MKPFQTLLCLIITVFLASVTSFAGTRVEIVLKNGGVVPAEDYFEEGDLICTYRYGALIKIPKASVLDIRQLEASADVKEVTPDPSIFQEKKRQPISDSGSTSGPENKEDECEQQLRHFRKQMQIYCGDAAHKAARVTRPPNAGGANRASVSKATADQFMAHVQSKVEASKASTNCEYYTNRVAYWEKKCGK